MDHILYQIFKIILNVFKKKKKDNDNLLIRTYVNKIENRIKSWAFNIWTIKLLGSIENEINKNINGQNTPHLEIAQ